MRYLYLVLVLLALCRPASAKDPFWRGICFCAGTVSTQSDKKLIDFVKQGRINLVVIDFFGLAYSYDRTNFSKISKFIKRLKKMKVTILADYRPSTTPPGKTFRGTGPDMCLSNPEIRKHITGWGIHILDKCPGIDILTIYNPLPQFERNKNCPLCTKRSPRTILQEFFKEWSKAIKKRHPKVKLGAVFPGGADFYRPLSPYLDVFCPFCSLIAPKGQKSTGPGVMKKLAKSIKALRKKGPIIPLVKLYWKQETRNTTADILAAMEEAKKEGLNGFFLWYHSLLTGAVARNTKYKLPTYDLNTIIKKYQTLAGRRK